MKDLWAKRSCKNFITLFIGSVMYKLAVYLPAKILYSSQADGTAWMAFYCTVMLSIALELAVWKDLSYEDMASKFFEHFVDISDAMNTKGLWDEEDGFYYDQLRCV